MVTQAPAICFDNRSPDSFPRSQCWDRLVCLRCDSFIGLYHFVCWTNCYLVPNSTDGFLRSGVWRPLRLLFRTLARPPVLPHPFCTKSSWDLKKDRTTNNKVRQLRNIIWPTNYSDTQYSAAINRRQRYDTFEILSVRRVGLWDLDGGSWFTDRWHR